jgi:hypothetical protein
MLNADAYGSARHIDQLLPLGISQARRGGVLKGPGTIADHAIALLAARCIAGVAQVYCRGSQIELAGSRQQASQPVTSAGIVFANLVRT